MLVYQRVSNQHHDVWCCHEDEKDGWYDFDA